jgi:zinc transport system substrate-binding protein
MLHLNRSQGLGWLVAATGLMVTAASASDPKVVVTMKPVHALVAQAMDGIAIPALVVDGAASPHTFTLKPSGAKAINEAGVFIRVSETVEPFTRKIVLALPKSVVLVSLSDVADMTLLEQRHGGAFEEHAHEDEKGHDDHDKGGKHAEHDDDDDHEGTDGHIWLDPANAKVIVNAVTKVLAEKYPEHAERLKSNSAIVLAKLDALTAEIETLLAPVKDKPFIVFHDATQYFEKRFGLAAAGSITVSPDVQPSAKRLTAVRKKIGALGAVCVFTEPGFQPNLVAAVTEGTKARSGTLDAEGQTLKPGPELYADLMLGLARNIRGCLQPVS